MRNALQRPEIVKVVEGYFGTTGHLQSAMHHLLGRDLESAMFWLDRIIAAGVLPPPQEYRLLPALTVCLETGLPVEFAPAMQRIDLARTMVMPDARWQAIHDARSMITGLMTARAA